MIFNDLTNSQEEKANSCRIRLNMTTKRKTLLLVALFLAILTGLRMVWLSFYTTPDHPYASQGVLDLRDWDLMTDHSITLDGQWEFYPNILLMTDQLNSPDETEASFIQVPGGWDSYVLSDTNKAFGYGSYRLRILTDPDKGKSFGIHVTNVLSSSEVYVNGKRIAQSGQPAEDERYQPLNAPYTAYFDLEEENAIELVIHVANFDDTRTGGIFHSLKFGLEKTLNRDIQFASDMVRIACVAYLIHALYGFVLFLVGNRDRRLIYFSLMILCIIIGTLMSEERLLFAWIPFSYEWSIKVIYLTMIAGGYFLLQCIKHRLPSYLAKPLLGYTVICGVITLMILVLPAPYNFTLQNLYISVMIIPCCLLPVIMFRTVTRKSEDNIFLLLAAVAAVNSLIWLIVIEVNQIEMISYPFDLIIATVLFAAFWFKQYFRVLAESQSLSQKLQTADKLKDDFLTTVAHELRNPLHGILNISQSISERERNSLGTKSVNDLETLIKVGRRMSYMLNDLLDVARLKERRIVLQAENVSVHIVTTTVFDMLRFMTEGKPIQFVNRVPSHFPLVIADENRLIQILFNLLHNAVKYSHAGEISVQASVEDGWASIAVSDMGIGIDEDMLDRVFEPYEQTSQGITSIGGGFGLGLSICKQLVELHGGTLNVSSQPNQGSIFTFTMPLSAPNAPYEVESYTAAQPSSYEESAAAHVPLSQYDILDDKSSSDRIRILAVDDDPVNLRVLESVLAVEPYEVFTATSGKEALTLLDARVWDLIIADVMMPNMSGYELTSRIRERFSVSELPVLLLTAFSRDEDIEAGFRAGANDYVTKPMNAAELKSRVRSLTNLKKSVYERLRLEAAWLQAQIKPHFIINTFNAISALSTIDTDRMDDLVEELCTYLRLSIDFQNSDQAAPLEHELKLLKSYLFIQKERFGDRLHIVWDVDDQIKLAIPPLTIQPLVENALNHGILNRMTGGEVRIQIADHESFVEVCVADNGVGIAEETLRHLLDRRTDKRSGIGLLNTDRRLKQFYGTGLNIESKLGVGTTVSFLIPKKPLGQELLQ